MLPKAVIGLISLLSLIKSHRDPLSVMMIYLLIKQTENFKLSDLKFKNPIAAILNEDSALHETPTSQEARCNAAAARASARDSSRRAGPPQPLGPYNQG